MEQLNLLQVNGASLEVSSDTFDYRPGIFSKKECARYLKTLVENTRWIQTSQFMYGKSIKTPRLIAWHGNHGKGNFTEDSPISAWTRELLEIKAKVEILSGIQFDSVLLNYYRDHHDSVAWHSDRDGPPGRNKHVASVSFGEERVFSLRSKLNPARKFSVLLENGSYLLMKGEFQDAWEHCVAKSIIPMGARINLTFRISGICKAYPDS